jgi:hypothetical protein
MRDEQKKTLIIFAVVGFAAGIILTGIGFGKWRTYRLGSHVPQDMTVAELSRNGPPENKHVRLHDCSPTSHYVHLGLKDSANFSQVWQALEVPGTASSTGRPRAVVLTSEDILDEKKMGPLLARDIDGLVVTDPHAIPDEARSLLKAQNPGLDFTEPVLVEVNGYPSRAKVLGLFGGGIALLLIVLGSVGGFLAVRWRQGRREGAPPEEKPSRRTKARQGPTPRGRSFP